jgi:hypothetical protein
MLQKDNFWIIIIFNKYFNYNLLVNSKNIEEFNFIESKIPWSQEDFEKSSIYCSKEVQK